MKQKINILKLVLTSILFVGLLCYGCSEEEEEKAPKPALDITEIELGNNQSYSNTHEVSAEQLHLDLDVNFSNKSIYGIARYRLKRHHSDTILFDINGLQIQKVTTGKIGNEKNTDYVIGIEDSTHGAPLSIKIKKNTRFVNIYYQTTDKPTNLHWDIDSLHPQNNLLFTIPGEYFTRNWIPIQDVSNHKLGFSIEIKNDCNLTPIFGSATNLHQLDSARFFYESPIKLAVYDIGFFMGNFQKKNLSKNISIYYLNQFNSSKISKEFNHFNSYLKSLKEVYNIHPWKEFNFCILPPKFPFKSYDYPTLSFIHPVNLSSYQNSGDFIQDYLYQTWPYPLFSTKCEDSRQLIIGINRYLALRGKSTLSGSEMRDLVLKTHIEQNRKNYSTQHIPLVRLTNIYTKPCDKNIQLSYQDRLNYQLKGFLFCSNLEKTIGKINFEDFLRTYYKKPTIHTREEFERELKHYLIQHDILDFNTSYWFNNSKVSKADLKFESKRYTKIHKDCKLFSYQRKFSKIKKFKKQIKKYTTEDWYTFISLLPKTIDKTKLDYLDYKLHLSTHPNRALQRLWFNQSIRLGYLPTASAIELFLSTYGDIESNYQLYELMINNSTYRSIAIEIYEKNETKLSAETKKALKPLFQRFIKLN
jgi:leukotriene-A4 hydrolase